MSSLLITENFPPKVGGSGRWFWELYRRLPVADFTILAGADADQSSFDRGHDLRLDRVPLSFSSRLIRLGSSREYLAAYRAIMARVRADRPELIYCGRWLPEGLLGLLVRLRTGIPYVCYAHGEEVNCGNGDNEVAGGPTGSRTVYGSRELGMMARVILKGARAIIANSENTCSLLEGCWGIPADRTHVLYPGVDTGRFVPAPRDAELRRRLGWDGRRVILTVGRLQRRKGQDTAIRALPDLIRRFPDLLYAIVGEGEDRGHLESTVESLHLQDHVMLMGKLDDDDLMRCYQQCDLFLLPNRAVGSDIEGFGMVLLEAQSCARPVMAGRSGGTREALVEGQTGWLVNCETSAALSRSLDEILGNTDLLKTMGETGREWVVRNFDWDSLQARANVLFRDLGR